MHLFVKIGLEFFSIHTNEKPDAKLVPIRWNKAPSSTSPLDLFATSTAEERVLASAA